MRAFCLSIVLCLALLAPAAALAQTPTDDVYDPVDKRTEVRADSSLPYTGGDIGLLLLAGAVVLGTGFAIRRASRT